MREVKVIPEIQLVDGDLATIKSEDKLRVWESFEVDHALFSSKCYVPYSHIAYQELYCVVISLIDNTFNI